MEEECSDDIALLSEAGSDSDSSSSESRKRPAAAMSSGATAASALKKARPLWGDEYEVQFVAIQTADELKKCMGVVDVLDDSDEVRGVGFKEKGWLWGHQVLQLMEFMVDSDPMLKSCTLIADPAWEDDGVVTKRCVNLYGWKNFEVGGKEELGDAVSFVVVPVHRYLHWCVLVVDVRSHNMLFFDSLKNEALESSEKLLELGNEAVKLIYGAMYSKGWMKSLSPEEVVPAFELYTATKRTQNDGYNCGLFIAFAAHALLKGRCAPPEATVKIPRGGIIDSRFRPLFDDMGVGEPGFKSTNALVMRRHTEVSLTYTCICDMDTYNEYRTF